MKNKWAFQSSEHQIADTGDYNNYVEFSNGKDILQTNVDDLEDEQCQQFCDFLNLMPGLWSRRCDEAEFERGLYKSKYNKIYALLINLNDPRYDTHDRQMIIEECLGLMDGITMRDIC